MTELREPDGTAEAVETVEPEVAPAVDAMTIGRRAALVAAVGGVAALAAQAVGLARPDTVEARDGYALVAGQTITATRTSGVTTDNGRTAFVGTSATGDGLAGVSNGPTKSGVYGVTANAQGYGVFGRNKASAATGALGTPVDGVAGTVRQAHAAGVRGTADHSASAGVVGENPANHVSGALGGLAGVSAFATDESRDALAVWGRATFLRAGIATVVSSTRAIVVRGVPTYGSTCVLALLQADRPAGISVQAATALSDTITIWLTDFVVEDTPVAWWAFELTPR